MEEKRMTNIEILKKDGCTEKEAKWFLANNTTVYEDFEENFESYLEEFDCDKDEIAELKEMIDKKIPLTDWGIVQDGDKTYYIMYAL